MKRILIMVLVSIFLISLVLAGCQSQAPAPAPTSSQAPAPKPATASPTAAAPVQKPAASPAASPAAPGTFRFSYALQSSATSWSAINATLPWMKQVEKATNGKVQFDVYWNQTLCKAADTWDALKYGIADSALCVHGNFPGLTPLSDVMSLPFIGFNSAQQASGIFWQLYEKYPSVQNELKDNHVLLLFASTPYFIINSKKEIKTLDNIKGMKLRVLGGPPTDTLKALGGVPMLVVMGDTYINLQKGVMDGMSAGWEAIYSFKLYEVVKYYSYLPLDCAYFSVTMSKDAWNKLPAEVQKQINSVSGLEGSKFWGYNYHDTPAQAVKDEQKKAGFPMIEYTLPKDEVDKWKKVAGEPIWDSWVKKMQASGKTDAKDILNTAIQLAQSTK